MKKITRLWLYFFLFALKARFQVFEFDFRQKKFGENHG